MINLAGRPGSPATLVDCRCPDFWDNIETGVRSTVRCVLDRGWRTVSSCEGHEEASPWRCFSVMAEQEQIHAFIQMIARFNAAHRPDIEIAFSVFSPDRHLHLYEDEFPVHPLIADVILGNIRDADLARKQTIFENYLCRYDFTVPVDSELVQAEIARVSRYGTHAESFCQPE